MHPRPAEYESAALLTELRQHGAGKRIRTPDGMLTRHPLCQLSYPGQLRPAKGRERLLPPRPMLVSQPLLLSTGMVCSGSSPPCPPACDERGTHTTMQETRPYILASRASARGATTVNEASNLNSHELTQHANPSRRALEYTSPPHTTRSTYRTPTSTSR